MSQSTPQQWQHAGKQFAFQGAQVFYKEKGKGPVLLCLHGYPTGSWDWRRVWDELAEEYRVIAPDLLGFGFSDKPRGPYSLLQQADLVTALLRHLRISQMSILAHDYGANVTQELLARYHEGGAGLPRFHAVCFLNACLFPENYRPDLGTKLMMSPLGGLLAACYTRARFEKRCNRLCAPGRQLDKEELGHAWDMVRREGGRTLLAKLAGYPAERTKHRERWVSALQRTSVPLRLIDGAMDPIAGTHMAERYRELVPHGDLTYLEDCGHFPHLEQPAAMLRALQAFMKRIAPAN